MVLGHWATTRTRDVILTKPTLDHFQGTFVGLKRVIEAAQQSPALYREPAAQLPKSET